MWLSYQEELTALSLKFDSPVRLAAQGGIKRSKVIQAQVAHSGKHETLLLERAINWL